MNFFRHITKQALAQHWVSAAALVAANLVPLLGVLFLGWSTFQIVALYWFENVVIGAINVLKMVACSPDRDEVDVSSLLQEKVSKQTREQVEQAGPLAANPWLKDKAKLFFVPFFIVHYGIFCLVHGVFVVVLLGGDKPLGGFGGLHGVYLNASLLIAAAGLAVSHLVSFFVNYLGKGENRRTILPVLMEQPYGRIMVLHIAIVLGAFVTITIGSPIFLLAILIVGKTLMDLNLHLREHETETIAPNEDLL